MAVGHSLKHPNSLQTSRTICRCASIGNPAKQIRDQLARRPRILFLRNDLVSLQLQSEGIYKRCERTALGNSVSSNALEIRLTARSISE